MQKEYWKNYPWYESVESDSLEQGDFIDSCQVIIPRYIPIDMVEESMRAVSASYQIESDTITYNVIIVSQSCDLDNAKVDYVLVCPRWSYTEVVKHNPKFGKKDAFERIKQGKEYRYCMLGECDLPDFLSEIQLVDLNMVFSVPYSLMKQIALSKGKRLRLRSPYKERLAQAFAYFHMRVALPHDLPTFEVAKASAQINIKYGH